MKFEALKLQLKKERCRLSAKKRVISMSKISEKVVFLTKPNKKMKKSRCLPKRSARLFTSRKKHSSLTNHAISKELKVKCLVICFRDGSVNQEVVNNLIFTIHFDFQKLRKVKYAARLLIRLNE